LSTPRAILHHDRDKHSRLERLKNAVRRTVPRAARNWLRSPSKSAEWLWDSGRFLFGITGSLEISPNSTIVCHPRAYKIFRRDQVDDPDQSAEFRSFISCCSNTMVLYDVGAHFGIFSLAAAGFGGRAIAVDASPAAADMIAIQASLNKCTDRIQILRAAVSDANSAIDMLNSGVFSDGYFKATSQRAKSELTQVQAITIDQMALQFGPPTHIKVDVEGHEAAVLRGARGTLSRFSPILFLELHNEMVAGAGDNPYDTVNELDELRYDTFTVDGYPIDASAILAKPIIRIVAKRRME
jgi:FkbM family methyltransferase